MIESIKIWLFVIVSMLLSLCGIELFTVDRYPEEYVYDYYSYEIINELDRARINGLKTALARLEIYKHLQEDYYYYPKPSELENLKPLYATEDRREIFDTAFAVCPNLEKNTEDGALIEEYYGLRFIADDGRQAYFPLRIYENTARATILGEKGWPLSACSSSVLLEYLVEKGITNATRP